VVGERAAATESATDVVDIPPGNAEVHVSYLMIGATIGKSGR
jgi:hypothetical protein